eukprot:Skav204508  [mRNA]  locus=scaffold527:316089:316823:+ [translate_table: standard]
MAGMTLWINLRATLRGEKLVTYWPQALGEVSFLGLLNLGDGICIASKGTLATHGGWLWELKDWIDRRWMWNYFEGRDSSDDLLPGPGSGMATPPLHQELPWEKFRRPKPKSTFVLGVNGRGLSITGDSIGRSMDHQQFLLLF